jgi:hypothetical protein
MVQHTPQTSHIHSQSLWKLFLSLNSSTNTGKMDSSVEYAASFWNLLQQYGQAPKIISHRNNLCAWQYQSTQTKSFPIATCSPQMMHTHDQALPAMRSAKHPLQKLSLLWMFVTHGFRSFWCCCLFNSTSNMLFTDWRCMLCQLEDGSWS